MCFGDGKWIKLAQSGTALELRIKNALDVWFLDLESLSQLTVHLVIRESYIYLINS